MVQRPNVVEVRRVAPDPSITSAIGRHHSLETAVADLVDNSIDAGARNVLVRVLQRDERAVGLLLVDDGQGMDTEAVDHAMGYARRREYGEEDLGHFGIGLKAASLSQADTLLVWSRRWGAPAVGRLLERESLDTGPLVKSISTEDAVERLAAVDAGFPLETGTVVEWRDVRGFLQSPDPEEQRAWLESAIERLRTHLGLTLHRILARGHVTVRIDVLDEDWPDLGTVARTVEPLDPFGYSRSGAAGFPQPLTLVLPDGIVEAELHVWPHDPTHPSWLLGGRTPVESQGLYVYRRDRLLQAGGWNGLTNPSRDLVHARVAVEYGAALAGHVQINPEKTGVTLDAVFTEAWASGRLDDGATFADYLEVVRTGARTSRKRNPRPVEVPEPGKGFTAGVVEAIEDNATYTVGTEPVSIRWKGLPDDQVVRVDRENRTLWVNQRYRAALGGTTGLRNDDGQVVKVLLHLLLAPHAAGAIAGAREKRLETAWNAMLLAAVQEDDARRPRSDHAPHGGQR